MTFSFDVVSLIPDSPLSAVTVAVMSVLPIEPPLRPTVAFSAIAKQAACADATSSSGLVCPAGSPMHAGNVTGSANAPLPALTCPLPSMIEPVHSTSACRENVAINQTPLLTGGLRPAGPPCAVARGDPTCPTPRRRARPWRLPHRGASPHRPPYTQGPTLEVAVCLR